MKIEFIGTCRRRDIAAIAEHSGRRFSYKRIVKLVKDQYPGIYESLSLDFYNPWEKDTRKIKIENKTYLNLVWSDIDHIFEVREGE